MVQCITSVVSLLRHILLEAVCHALVTDAIIDVAGLVLEQRNATYAGESLLLPSPQHCGLDRVTHALSGYTNCQTRLLR
jgi:hypothetical protein